MINVSSGDQSFHSLLRPLLLLSSRPWNAALAERLRAALKRPVHTISQAGELYLESVLALDPAWIFVPHWSNLIPESIWSRWPTVIFHMTDLPYGRGGSPLQNLIQRGHTSTILTALRCSAELDAGPIYLQHIIELQGTELVEEWRALQAGATVRLCLEWFDRHAGVIDQAVPQQGQPTHYRRRQPSDSQLDPERSLADQFNMLRVVDNERYPAFFEWRGRLYYLQIPAASHPENA